MKIRINNIFINNKKNNTNKELNSNSTLDEMKIKSNIKKVYDEKENYKNEVEKDNQKIEKQEEIRKRKGYKSDKGIFSNIKIGKYFSNLILNKNKLSKGYYVLLIAMVFLGGGSVYIATKTYALFEQENYDVYSSIDNELPVENVENLSGNNEVVELNNSKSNTEEQSNNTSHLDTITEFQKSTTKEENVATNKTTVKKEEPLNFIKPIEGNIQKIFSLDKVIYSKTLELWKVHDGIDISANIGEYVKAIEKGTVERIYDDSFYGITIVINHGQGYKSCYSNLDETTLVKESQKITKGQKIGKVGKTSIGEIKDESHIHFMLYKNDSIIDPTFVVN